MMDMSHNEKHSELRERIVEESVRLFLERGYSKVTVDEIVDSLGISKKTLYKLFSKKEELLEAVFTFLKGEMLAEIEGVMNDSQLDLLERVKKMLTITGMRLAALERAFLKDLKGRQPHMWDKMKELETEKLLSRCEDLFEEGIRQGLFKENLHKAVVIRFYFEAIRNLLVSDILLDLPLSMTELFDSILVIIFEGVLTEEAHNRYRRQR